MCIIHQSVVVTIAISLKSLMMYDNGFTLHSISAVVAQSVLYLPLTISLSRIWGAPPSSKSLVVSFFLLSLRVLHYSGFLLLPQRICSQKDSPPVLDGKTRRQPKACSAAHMMWPSTHPPTSHRRANWHTGSVLRSTQLCVAVLEGPRGAGGAFSPCCLFTVTKHGRTKAAAAADDVLCSSFPFPLILVAGTKL